jgi:alcohol dehydrogenase
MKALLYHEFKGALGIETVPDPSPSPGGVIIKVKATGLCRSDWHGWMGHDSDIRLPHVPGHELAGIVEAIGSEVKKVSIGDRVTVPFVCGCGHCEQCDSGNQQVCDHQTQPGFTHWGSFAEYVMIENADINVVQLPPEIADQTAAILGCRFITAYRAIVAQAKVKAGDFVGIHGCGGVGLSAIMIANALGAQVIAVDINDETLALAKKMGATHCINAHKEKAVVSAIMDYTKGGVQVSVDALGSNTTCVNSISSLRKRGKHIQVGLLNGERSYPEIPMGRVLADELEIIGSHGMQAHKYPEMLQLIINQQLRPELLIEKSIKLEDAIFELPNMDTFSHKGVLVIDSF